MASILSSPEVVTPVYPSYPVGDNCILVPGGPIGPSIVATNPIVINAVASPPSASTSDTKQNNSASISPLPDDVPSGSVSVVVGTVSTDATITTTNWLGCPTTSTIETLTTKALTTETLTTKTLTYTEKSISVISSVSTGTVTGTGNHVLPLVLGPLLGSLTVFALAGAWLWFRRRQRARILHRVHPFTPPPFHPTSQVWTPPRKPDVVEVYADAGWRAQLYGRSILDDEF
ncbi:hypothetical protein DENSPDRAFT_884929 [Dentipellis sp. KUC8613]|nr:hypothetical protein DENSPDRAFT_884929 [Dentipellis sp. KUC8613]